MERCLDCNSRSPVMAVSMECGTNPKDPDVQEALEEYERSVVHCNRRVYKLEEIEYPDVSPLKRVPPGLFWNTRIGRFYDDIEQ